MGNRGEVQASETARRAIPQLFDTYGPGLRAFSLRLCGSPEEADDLVQETFLRAFRKWEQFQGLSSAKTWLYSIAIRVCMRLHRKRSGEPARMESFSELLPSGQKKVPDIASSWKKPDEIVFDRELRCSVESAISKLPIHFRLPLVLKDLAELSVPEISDVLGLKPATVKTRIHRARLFLRKQLAASLPCREADEPDHSKRVCLDLLKAKQEALDRGVPFPYPDEELCDRCRSLFATLDLGFSICRELARGRIPKRLRVQVEKKLSAP